MPNSNLTPEQREGLLKLVVLILFGLLLAYLITLPQNYLK